MNKYTVAWIPNTKALPTSTQETLELGGRIIDKNLTKLGAEEVERCLKINGEGLAGSYITIKQ